MNSSKIINMNLCSVEKELKSLGDQKEILIGLGQKEIAFVISPPDTGKGYFTFSIALELATNKKLLGVKAPNTSYVKVLMWQKEDGVKRTMERSAKILKSKLFNEDDLDLISSNIGLYCQETPCNFYDEFYVKNEETCLTDLLEKAEHYDVVVVDTIRDIFRADEVKDDAKIRDTLDFIAKTANVSIICTHHTVKAQQHNNTKKINSITASGLSYTSSLSRLHYYLDTSKTGEVKLTTSKGNNADKKFNEEPLKWMDNILILKSLNSLEHLEPLPSGSASDNLPDYKDMENLNGNSVQIEHFPFNVPVNDAEQSDAVRQLEDSFLS